jgi:cytidyltransferase-like protein
MLLIGVCSGYFSPVHAGHIQYINAAKGLNHFVIVVVNNDEQVKMKTGGSVFMKQDHRLNIIQNLKSVDLAFVSRSPNNTICCDLKEIKEALPTSCITFYNSGDVTNTDEFEQATCDKLGITVGYIRLPKIYSSRNFREKSQ